MLSGILSSSVSIKYIISTLFIFKYIAFLNILQSKGQVHKKKKIDLKLPIFLSLIETMLKKVSGVIIFSYSKLDSRRFQELRLYQWTKGDNFLL